MTSFQVNYALRFCNIYGHKILVFWVKRKKKLKQENLLFRTQKYLSGWVFWVGSQKKVNICGGDFSTFSDATFRKITVMEFNLEENQQQFCSSCSALNDSNSIAFAFRKSCCQSNGSGITWVCALIYNNHLSIARKFKALLCGVQFSIFGWSSGKVGWYWMPPPKSHQFKSKIHGMRVTPMEPTNYSLNYIWKIASTACSW